MKRNRTFILMVILAFIGGFFNAYSFYMRGGRYAFLQTGTLIAIIYDLFIANYKDLWFGLSTFFSFYLGILFTIVLNKIFHKYKKEKYLRFILLSLSFILMVPCLFFNQTKEIDLSFISIWSIGIMGGIMLEGFKDLVIPSVTTMMTNNTRLFVKHLSRGIMDKDKHFFKIAGLVGVLILSFILGVIIFLISYLYTNFVQYSVLAPLLLLLCLIIIEVIFLYKKDYDLAKYEKTYIPDEYLKLEDEILVNHLLFVNLVELKKMHLKEEIFQAIYVLNSKKEELILQNEIAKKLYIYFLIEEEQLNELKIFLKKL
ncbi:MAG: DUF1275 domain-containing protein [Anaeroplasmataceae bacterium]|nr:DUF1275 domain-containing protein [Anaeroplasmataceae bacterium]